MEHDLYLDDYLEDDNSSFDSYGSNNDISVMDLWELEEDGDQDEYFELEVMGSSAKDHELALSDTEDHLLNSATRAIQLYRDIKKDSDKEHSLDGLDESIKSLYELVYYFAKPDAMNDLCSLIEEIDPEEFPEQAEAISQYLCLISSSDTLPVQNKAKNTHQATQEIQELLIQTISMSKHIDRYQEVIDSLANNSKLSNEYELKALLS